MIQIYYQNGTQFREYKYYIDLSVRAPSVEKREAAIRGVIYTVIERELVGDFASGLSTRNLLTPFRMRMKGLTVGTSSKAWVELIPRLGPPFPMQDSIRDLRSLLDFLHSSKLPIIWKEGKHGYLVDPNGTIERKWNLDPF